MSKKVYYKKHLPHIQPLSGYFFVTFSLYESIPGEKLRQIYEEYHKMSGKERLLINYGTIRDKYFSDIDDAFNTDKHGPHYLKDERVATIVAESLHYWDSKLIDLCCYCIMSNHVHLLFRLLNNSETSEEKYLSDILQSIKSYTGRKSNEILDRHGQFWARESYDYHLRMKDDIRSIIRYIVNNPVKAGLCQNRSEWQWSYVKNEFGEIFAGDGI